MIDVENSPAFRIRNALVTITRCWAHMLPTSPAATTAGTIGRHATGSRPPVPAHVLDVRSETLARLNGWTRIVLEERDLNTSIDGGDALAMGALLKRHADWLGDHEASEDALAELEDSARRCQGIAEPHAAVKFAGTCDVCSGDLMGDGRTARCKGCSAVVDGATQQERVRVRVRDMLMTAAELVNLSPQVGRRVQRVQVDRWIRGSRIASKGTTPEGKPLYSVEAFLGWLVPDAPEQRSA